MPSKKTAPAHGWTKKKRPPHSCNMLYPSAPPATFYAQLWYCSQVSTSCVLPFFLCNKQNLSSPCPWLLTPLGLCLRTDSRTLVREIDIQAISSRCSHFNAATRLLWTVNSELVKSGISRLYGADLGTAKGQRWVPLPCAQWGLTAPYSLRDFRV